MYQHIEKLWFDVGIKRYTTVGKDWRRLFELWFDVGIKRYTTLSNTHILNRGCGLM